MVEYMQEESLTNPRRRRAMTTEAARKVKLAGHQAEGEFAELIGGSIYAGSRKRDVVDKQGNIHSVKSGEKKWQIFLYGRKRFEESVGFPGARLFVECIDSFPENREEYLRNKTKLKSILQPRMRALRDFLLGRSTQDSLHSNKIVFLQEALFHSSEVDYFTIKEGNMFHIFDAEQVIKTIDNSVTVVNSKAARKDQMDEQKVVFKVPNGTTIGEIEMRNDSDVHYRQVKFWMDREKTLDLLRMQIKPSTKKMDRMIVYGKAVQRFKP